MAEKNESKDQEKTTESKTVGYYYHKPWLVPALIAIIVIVIVGVAFSFVAFRHGRYGFYGGDRGIARMRGYAFDENGQHGSSYLIGPNSNQSRLRGVVTSVNGSSFTLAGDGATNTIQTNGSTQYQNGSSVKVNDSVVVYGTTNNGTFTADTVVVNP